MGWPWLVPCRPLFRLKIVSFTASSSHFSLQATASCFQKLTESWNCTELLRSDSPVSTSWYVLFCTAFRQAWFVGSQKWSQKWCLTIVRHHFWDRQASFLGSSGMFFGIVRHLFWDLTLIFWSLKRHFTKKNIICEQNRWRHCILCTKIQLLDAFCKSGAPSL